MGVKLTEFLSVFYPDEDEPIRVRGFAPSGYPKLRDSESPMPFGPIYPIEYTVTRRALTTDQNLRNQILRDNEHHGMYFMVNAGIPESKRLDVGVYALA